MQSKAARRCRTEKRHAGALPRDAALLGRATSLFRTQLPRKAWQQWRVRGCAAALTLIGIWNSAVVLAQQTADSGAAPAKPAVLEGEQAGRGDIIWSQRASQDGLLVGVKLEPSDGRVRAGETLGLQFVLRNDSLEPQHVRCLNGTEQFLDVEVQDGNYLFPGGFRSRPGVDEIDLKPGEIYEAENHRAEFSTQGLLDGEYTFFPLGAYNVSTKVSATRATGYVSGIAITVGDGRARIAPPPEMTPSMQVYWGEVRSGLALGAQLVRLENSSLHPSYRQRSGRFTVDDELELQLHLVNVSDQTQVVDIEIPSGTLWPVSISSESSRTWQRRSRRGSGARVRLQLAPGEQRPVTGVEVPFIGANATGDSVAIQRAVANAIVRIGANDAQSRKATEFHPDFGSHSIKTNITLRPAASDALKVELDSGDVPFRVVPPLPESQ